MIKEKTPSFYYAMLLVTTAAWSMSFIWSKQVTNTGMSSEVYLFVRYGAASLLLLPFSINSLKRMTKKQFLAGVTMGLIFFGGIFFQTVGISMTSPSNSSFITTAYVVMAPFTTWLMTREKPSKSIYPAAAMCLVGIYVLSMRPGETIALSTGNLLTLIGALGWALQLSYTSVAGRFVPPVLLSFLSFSVTSLGGLALALVGGSLKAATAAQFSAAALPIILAAIFPTIVANMVQVWAQPKVNANNAAIIYSLEAVFATIISILIGMEPWSANVAVGGAVIFAAVLLAQFGGKRNA